MKNWLCVLSLLFTQIGYAQECLKLLDSATLYQGINKTKTSGFLQTLILKLDSGECNVQIGYAEAYNNAGLIYQKINDQRSASESLLKACSYKLQRYDSFAIELLPYYDNLYSIYRSSGKYQKAGHYLELAEKTLANTLEEDRAYLNHLIKSGIFYKEIGLLDKSSELLSKAKTIIEAQPVNDSIQGSVLIEYGTLLTLKGEYEAAQEELERAINILRTQHPILHARAVDRMAKLMMENGQLSQSESGLLSNISFKKNRFPNDSLILVESLNNLGVLYFRINDLNKAKSYFAQVLTIGERYAAVKPFGLNNLGVIYLRQNQPEKAIECFNEASKYFASTFGTLHQDYANSINNLAGVYHVLGDHEQALSLYNQVLDLDKTLFGESHPKYATSLTNLAHVYAEIGYIEVARNFIERATVIKQKALGEYHHDVAKSLDDLGLMNLVNGDTLLALQAFDSALSISLHHIRSIFPALTDAQRTLAFDQIRYSLRRFSSISFTEKYFNTIWSEKALNYTINTKSILFYSADKMRRLTQESNNPGIIYLYQVWRKRGIQLANAYLLTNHEREVQGISIPKIEEEYYELEKSIAQRIGALSLQSEITFVKWNDISHAMKDSTALVEIVQYRPYEVQIDSAGIKQGFTDESYYVSFVIKPGEILEMERWKAGTKFNRQFSVYRNSLKYSIPDTTSFAQLWSGIDQHLTNVYKVYFAGDGNWHEINPSIFYDTREKEYVADKYEVLNITSGKDLISQPNKALNRTAQIFGNPDFTNHLFGPLDQLEGAEEEARQISSILRKNKWEIDTYVGKKATEEALKKTNQPGVLHIGTHGFFTKDDETKPLLNSGLFLTAFGKSDDGKLTAHEAMNLVLDQTQLVVLSACETGLGEVQNGEGVFGLQRAFLTAGADNLIITLVKINDQATMDFMRLFYQHYVDLNHVEHAFFQAQREFKQAYPNPLDWGAFVLISKR